ncbi:MAG: hypothetical protein RL088_1750 [Verrucomicrobiota bacterium]|jgi:hypothetical protein
MRSTLLLGSLLVSLASLPAAAAITFTGLTDKTKYNDTVTFTVVADNTANTTTTATLDGVSIPVGVPKVLAYSDPLTVRYHEVLAESRDNTTNAVVDTKLIRFIVRDNTVRGDTESGIPQHTPYKSVNDAPSAFAGQTLKVIAPAAWPANLPVPMAVKLVNGSNETVRLNGIVALGGFPGTTVQMRRGWGSVVAPAKTAAGTVNVAANVNGATANPAINIEAAPLFTDVSGAIASNTTWPANSRINVTGTLTVNAGVTLTIGDGTIVKVYTGTGTAGSAAEIVVNGSMIVNGTEGNPCAFVPATAGARWGGIELPNVASNVTANWTLFHGSGEQQNWFAANSGYSSHKDEQALFLISGAGVGTSVGAQLHLNDCFCFSLGGQQMNSKIRTWINLNRTLMMRAVTCGELNDSKVTIDRCALLEFPGETSTFADADNDGIYLTSGDLKITNTIIGFTKDDGVDSGGNGGASPFGTIDPATGTTTTRFESTNNWYEGTFHEGNSLSGTRNVYFTGCVFLNCGQGVEAGYSASGTGDGPNALVDGCLFSNNMVGVRWGDNYGSGYNYNGTMEVKNSLLLNSMYKDAFSGQWHPTQSNAWIYQTTNTNSFGKPYFNVHDNHISQPNPVHHPLNTAWNPANPAHSALIEPFMPVPGSNVGVAISTYQTQQSDTSAYAGTFTARLSTFSSKTVSVGWAVFGKVDPLGESETTLASGTLTFQPGDTLESFTAAVPTPGNYGMIRVALGNPVNAEVTGEQVYIKAPTTPVATNYFLYGSGGTGAAGLTGTPGSTWKAKVDFTSTSLAAFVTASGSTWKNEGFDDSTWATIRTQTGFGDSDENQTYAITDYDTGTTGTQIGPVVLFRSTFNVASVAALASVAGEVKSDDGAVVYINGTEIFRSPNVAASLTAYATVGIASAPADNLTAPLTVPLNLLHDGVNTIAVSVHQYNNTTSDATFDLKLTGNPIVTTPLVLNLSKSGGQPVLYWFGTNDVLERSTDLQNWFPMPVTGSPVSISPGAPQEFFRLRR